MSALLRRLRPGRDTPTAADPAAGEAHASDTVALETAGAPPPAPAGTAPEELIGDRPDTRRRGRLRRRLRHLRQVRELVLRDVGGLLYEVHRAGADPAARGHGMELVQAKLERLAALDAERLELEEVLGDRRSQTVLREPGVGGTCPTCGEYFASDARFCSRCGTRVDGHGTPEPPAGEAARPGETEPPAGTGAPAGAEAPAEPRTEVRS